MKHFFLFLLALLPYLGWSQTIDVKFDGSVANYDLSKKEAGVTIAIIQNGATVVSATTATNGKYSLKGKVDVKTPFDVVFTKSSMVSKRINFNLNGINLEDSPAGDLKPVEALDIELFAERPGVDFSFLNTQPIGKFTWNSQGYAQLDQNAMKAMTDKINKLLKDAEIKNQQNDLAYNQAVQAADKAYAAKDYKLALAKYEEATKFKPKEMHPINRINEIDAILQKQKENDLKDQQDNAAYNNLITAADNFFKAGDYEKAKAKYYEASDISDKQYPLDQIKEIARLVREKESEGKYKQLIDAADVMLKQKSYKSAKDNYTEALKLKPNEQYPKDKIKEIDDKLKGEADIQAKKAEYEKLVAEGEQLLKTEKWEDAKVKFEQALKIESGSTYVQGQIETIKKKLAELQAEKEKQEKIAKLITEGNQAFVAKTYDGALAKFKEVITLDAANATAKAKIDEINGILAEQQKNKELLDKFNALVKQGDDANTAKKFTDALTKYKEAIALKPDTGVDIKIQEVEKKIADAAKAAEVEANFAKLVQEGATAFTAKDYPAALAKYEAALEIKSGDAAVATKIADIKKIMGDQLAANQKLEKINKLLQEGTELMEGGVMDGVQLEPARAKFTEVLSLDPQNATAKTKIAAIDAQLKANKEAADKEAKFKENVAKGDQEMANSEWTKAISFYNVAITLKDDASVKQKIADAQAKLGEVAAAKQLEADYQKAIADGAALKTAKKYTEAIAKFEQAKTLKPSEALPQNEINAITALMGEQAAAQALIAQINALVQEGETAFSAKDYVSSKAKFEQVIGLDNNHANAKKRLADIDIELKKLAADAEKSQQIATLLQEGESLFNKEDLPNAEAKFKQVLTLESTNATAKKFLADIATKQNEQKQAADLLAKFNNFVTQGDNAASASKFQDAINAYTQALALKSGDAQVQQKIAAAQSKLGELSAEQELNAKYLAAMTAGNALRDQSKYNEAIAKYTEALTLKPAEQQPKTEIDKVNALIQKDAKAKQITDLLSEGNQILVAKDYTAAKAKFNEVLAIDPTNSIATAKLTEIENALKALAANEANEAEFTQLKANGMSAYSAQDYNNAMLNFEKALKIKGDAEIQSKINEILAKRNEESQKNTKITELLAKGKSAFDGKKWLDAQTSYNAVLAIDPQNASAKSQLVLIDQELAKESDQAETLKEFNRLKTQGLNQAQSGQLTEAITTLTSALAIKSDAEITTKIADIKKQIADKDQVEKIEKDYLSAMDAAAGFENNQDWTNALKKYKEASSIKTTAQLPKDKINQIQSFLDNLNASAEKDKKYTDALAQGDQLMSALKYAEAINKFKEASQLKPGEETPIVKLRAAEKALEDANKNAANVALEKLVQDIQTKIVEENTTQARNLLKDALAIQSNDPRLANFATKIEQLEKEETDFKAFLKKGGELESSKNYEQALIEYEKAKVTKPLRPEPNDKIARVKSLLDQSNAENEKLVIYQQYFNAGIENAKVKEYELALNNFKNALNAKPNDAAALAKIKEVEDALEAMQAQNKAKAAADQAFNKMVAEADELFNNNNYQKAAEAYRQILTVRPENAYAKRQLNESERLNKQESLALLNQQYQKILDVADNNFRAKNYDRALEYYKRALSIKSSDMYPKKRIEEINALLNPVAEDNGELKPLGEPFTGSILDGEQLLKQAEEQRKDAKRNRLVKAESNALASSEKMAETKSAELTETISSIYNLYTTLIVQEKVKAVDKTVITNSVNKADTKRIEIDNENSVYQYQNAVNTQLQVEDQYAQIAKSFDVNDAKHQENIINVDKVRMFEQDQTATISSNNHNESISVDENIASIKKAISEDTQSSNEEQALIAFDVADRRVVAQNMESQLSTQKYDETVASKQKVENTYSTVASNASTSEKIQAQSGFKLQEIDHAMANKNTATANQYHDDAISVKSGVNDVVKSATESEQKQIAKTVESNEVIKQTAEEIVQKNSNRQLENTLKNNETKALVTEAERKEIAQKDAAQNQHKEKVSSVSRVENTTATASSAKSKSDDQERLNTQRDMELRKEEQRQREMKEAERLKEKAETLKEMEKSINSSVVSQQNEQKQNLYDAKKEIDKVEVKEVNPTNVPNSLGEKYPEGVSQEIFQRKDDAGILSAIVTRRIVVIGGRGNEYVRTQNSSATTYSKNGKPITEYVWQRETQDAKLQRHY